MQYHFSSSNATYDSSKKAYIFSLSKRIPDAKKITIENLQFQLQNYSAMPQTILARSKALTSAFQKNIVLR